MRELGKTSHVAENHQLFCFGRVVRREGGPHPNAVSLRRHRQRLPKLQQAGGRAQVAGFQETAPAGKDRVLAMRNARCVFGGT